jgi:hypothetical protein
LGITITISWEVIFGGIPAGILELRPGVVGYILMCLASWPVLARPRPERCFHRTWSFGSAMAITDLPSMAIRSEQLPAILMELLAGTLALILLSSLLLLRWNRPVARFPGWSAWLTMGSAVLTVIAFQVYNRWARAAGVPNEDRSLIVGGVEIHHLNWGVLFLFALISTAYLWPSGRMTFTAVSILLGLSAGMVWDEWFYYARTIVSDAAYFATSTWVAAAVLMAITLGVWMRFHSSEARAP